MESLPAVLPIRATLLQRESNIRKDWGLWQLSRPVKFRSGMDDDGECIYFFTQYVISSISILCRDMGIPEAHVFAANNFGEIVDWTEVHCFRGDISHEEVIGLCGWETA